MADYSSAQNSRKHLLVYGLQLDGNLVHIDDVVSGLACECRCPDCSGQLVARKGEVMIHHFAHHAVMDCPGGGWETALHRFSKQVFQNGKSVMLPEAIAVLGNQHRHISKAVSFTYDSVDLEVPMSGFVPDVVLKAGNHRLLVEVLVTHRCGPAKLALLQEQGLACIEIDMSGVSRELSSQQHEQWLLHDAPRRWLYNGKIHHAMNVLKQEHDIKQAAWLEHRQTSMLPRMKDAYRQQPQGCFCVPAAKWQTDVVTFLHRSPGYASGMDDILSHLTSIGDMKSAFAQTDITSRLMSKLHEHDQDFVTSSQSIQKYLGRVGASIHGDGQTVSVPVQSMLSALFNQGQEREYARRLKELEGYMSRLCRRLPHKKNELAEWSAGTLAQTAMTGDTAAWQQCKNTLEKVLHMLSGGPVVDPALTMGLPLR